HHCLLAEQLAHRAVGRDAEQRVVAAARHRRRRRRAALGRLLRVGRGGLRRLRRGRLLGPARRNGRGGGARQRRGAAAAGAGGQAAGAAPLRRRRRAGVDRAVRRHEQAAYLRLRGAEDDEALAAGVDAVDEAALVGAGVEAAVGGQRQAEDVLVLRL